MHRRPDAGGAGGCIMLLDPHQLRGRFQPGGLFQTELPINKPDRCLMGSVLLRKLYFLRSQYFKYHTLKISEWLPSGHQAAEVRASGILTK